MAKGRTGKKGSSLMPGVSVRSKTIGPGLKVNHYHVTNKGLATATRGQRRTIGRAVRKQSMGKANLGKGKMWVHINSSQKISRTGKLVKAQPARGSGKGGGRGGRGNRTYKRDALGRFAGSA